MKSTARAALEAFLGLTSLYIKVKRNAWGAHFRLDRAKFKRKA